MDNIFLILRGVVEPSLMLRTRWAGGFTSLVYMHMSLMQDMPSTHGV